MCSDSYSILSFLLGGKFPCSAFRNSGLIVFIAAFSLLIKTTADFFEDCIKVSQFSVQRTKEVKEDGLQSRRFVLKVQPSPI